MLQGVGVLLAAEGRELLPEHLVHALQQAQEGGRLDAGDRYELSCKVSLGRGCDRPGRPSGLAPRRVGGVL